LRQKFIALAAPQSGQTHSSPSAAAQAQANASTNASMTERQFLTVFIGFSSCKIKLSSSGSFPAHPIFYWLLGLLAIILKFPETHLH
jgi:hypothetical protein